jgi:hypothetical protein
LGSEAWNQRGVVSEEQEVRRLWDFGEREACVACICVCLRQRVQFSKYEKLLKSLWQFFLTITDL